VLQVCDAIFTRGTQKLKKKKGFGLKEELMINLFGKIIAILTDSILDEIQNEKLQGRQQLFINTSTFLNSFSDFLIVIAKTVTEILKNRNLQDLQYCLRNILPSYFNFDHVQVLFYNRDSNTKF